MTETTETVSTYSTYDPELLERIDKTINKIRPYIQADGGDVQLVDFENGVVKVRMLGACAGCMAIDTTLTDGIEAILMDEIPEVTKVELDTEYAINPFEGYNGFRF